MDDDNNTAVREFFFRALDKNSPEELSAYLDEACSHDPLTRSRVERLLRAHDQAGKFLGGLPTDSATIEHSSIDEQPGELIGPYKLLRQIGEGGFGVVFLAEQTAPVRREVALKIVKPGMDTRQVIARFEAERQVLAMMDHPNIAKVFDAGTTGEGNRAQGTGNREQNSVLSLSPVSRPLSPHVGRPYFVMELVQGVPITEYCDQCNITTRERLELFITVCRAVQHAHQKGIIHRDLKPTNVLVAMQDGRPAPKVIDFGVAKAIDQQLTEHTLTAAFAQMVGTPLYMSPEQAELSPVGVDTRSDIYSLGVMLYELLTGATPFDKERLHSVPYDELRRIIREEEPPRPSARITTLAADKASTIAEYRRTDARQLGQQVRGELDWIVMKCLDKDRNRRYETANALMLDVERYLADEPVHAWPPSTSYRLRKFARRNKSLLAAGGAIAAALIIGLGLSTWMYLRERAAVNVAKANEARATTESARAKAVSDLFREIIFSPSRGWRIKGRQYTAREMFNDYVDGLQNQLADQPDVEAELRHAFGCSYLMLGVPDRAEPNFQRAIELRRSVPGPRTVSLADSLAIYGTNLYMQRRYGEAEPPLREALELYHQRGVRGTMPIFVCKIMQQALAASGRHDAAERAIQQAWAEMQGYGELPPEFAQSPLHDVAVNCAGFACYFATIGKQDEAAEFLRRATFAQQRLRNPVDKIGALQFLGQTRLQLGDEAGYREACARLVSPSPRVDNVEYNLGRIWVCCQGPDAVEDPSDLVTQAKEFAANNSLRAPYVHLVLLGAANYRAVQYEQAARCLEESIAHFPSDPPPSHGTVLWPQLFLAMTKWQQGKLDDARTLLSEIEPEIDKWLETPSTLWQYHVNTEVLRREAQALIQPKAADDPLTNNENRRNSAP